MASGSEQVTEQSVQQDTQAAYTAACAFFGEQVLGIGDEDWPLPTACAAWDVRSVVAHVVLGEAMVAELFAGGGVGRVTEVGASVLGPDPVATWRGTAVAALDAASVEGVLGASHLHPLGELPGTVIVGFRVTENIVHGWDLARAVGADVELPVGLAERCLDFWQPLVGSTVGSHVTGGHFADPIVPSDDATAGVRLLALLGRAA